VQGAGHGVAVTGMGLVTVLGDSLSSFGDALFAGRSGITRWKRMDERCHSRIGGDLSDFDLEAHLLRVGAAYPAELLRRARRLLRPAPLSGRITAAAALQAFVDAGLPATGLEPERFGHVLAGHNLNQNYVYENNRTFGEEPEYIDALFGLLCMDTDVLSTSSEILGLRGCSWTVGGACASGNLAVLTGLDLLRSGRADAVLVSGGNVDLDPVVLHAWSMMEAVSYRAFNDAPARASRPFDALREGFVPSEGAGALVLETLDGARARGARVHAEILGAFAASDASRLTRPDRAGQVRAMRGALRDAGIAPGRIDYVNAHATSTPLGDAVEVEAIKEALGERAYQIPVNATKSLIGHCMTAAGVIELIATILQMQRGMLHPTINQEEKDPLLDLDFVPNRARPCRIEVALSNAFGFGGLNSCVVVGKAS
jgi:3-oxoacyl-(acyl-carrier-protein) synthase